MISNFNRDYIASSTDEGETADDLLVLINTIASAETGGAALVAAAAFRKRVRLGAVNRVIAELAVPDDTDVYGLVNGERVLVGHIPTPPRMKAREIATSMFGGFEADDGSNGEMCFAAMEELIDHMVQSGYKLTRIADAEAGGSQQ